MKTAEVKTNVEAKKTIGNLAHQSRQPLFFSTAQENGSSFFASALIQPKLEIARPDYQYEQEADRVADVVVNTLKPQVQRQADEEEEEEFQIKQQAPGIQQKCEGCGHEEQLQKKSNMEGFSAVEHYASREISSRLRSKKGSGSQLPKGIQSDMQNKMGADFSGVNIHTDLEAVQMNRKLGARAFTHGSDIYFNMGKYQPNLSNGKHLLAHELTHVLQQASLSQSTIMKQDDEHSEQSLGEASNETDVVIYEFEPENSPQFIDNAFDRTRWNLVDNYYELIPYSEANGIRVPKNEILVNNDPLAAFSGTLNNVYSNNSAAELAVSQMGLPGLYTFYFRDGYIFPTVISDTTCPILIHNIRRTFEVNRQNAQAAEDLSWHLLWWYTGARTIRPQARPSASNSPSALTRPSPAGGATATVFNASAVTDDLFNATSSIASNGRRMIEVAKRLSAMPGLTAQQKVEVIMLFFNRIGFAISRAGIVDEGASLVMHSEDGLYAFRFMKETGEILYARFDMQTAQYVFRALQ